MYENLTVRQGQVLGVIRQFIQKHGVSPTLREMADRLGIKTVHGVVVHLRALEKKGAITRKPCLKRSITIVSQAGPTGPDPQRIREAFGAFSAADLRVYVKTLLELLRGAETRSAA